MDVRSTHWCGLDVGKKEVVACVIVPGEDGRPTKTIRRFPTMTEDLEALARWLREVGCTHVAMESTGVYWQPIWNVLEEAGAFALLLVNARHVKIVPGRKTDVKDAEWLADLLRHGLVRGSYVPDRAQRALLGRLRPHHRFLLAELLAMIDALDERIDAVSAEIAERERPFAEDLARLDTSPGIGQRVAEIVIAELGPDLSHVPSASPLASWAGVGPGNHESAGKRKSGKTRSGNAALRRALVEAARPASRSSTYLRAQYSRLKPRRGAQRAAVAVAHSIIRIIDHVLTRKTDYKDLGPDYFDRRDAAATERQRIKRLERLGNKVSIEKVA